MAEIGKPRSSDQGAVIPDAITPILGWRVWRPDGQGRQLCSLIGQPWPIRAPLTTAEPIDGADFVHPQGASAGIHALRRLSHVSAIPMFSHVSAMPWVVGRVALWGRVAIHALGYRAEQAYPVALISFGDQSPVVESLAFRYGIPMLRAYEVPHGQDRLAVAGRLRVDPPSQRWDARAELPTIQWPDEVSAEAVALWPEAIRVDARVDDFAHTVTTTVVCALRGITPAREVVLTTTEVPWREAMRAAWLRGVSGTPPIFLGGFGAWAPAQRREPSERCP